MKGQIMEIRDILWNERISGWKKVKNLRIKNLGGGGICNMHDHCFFNFHFYSTLICRF